MQAVTVSVSRTGHAYSPIRATAAASRLTALARLGFDP